MTRNQEARLAIIKITGVAILLYCVLVASLYLFQRRILFAPGQTPPDRLASGVVDMDEVEIQTADGLTLRSWYSPPDGSNPTIVYFQGNAGTIAGRGYKARHFIDRGYGILLLGYRGYGGNSGEPSEAGLVMDGRAALGYLADRDVPRGKVILYGESLGTGVAVALATEGQVRAVILESPYASIEAIAAARYWYVPVRLLLKDRFDSISRIGRIDAPLLILHGEQDGVIDVEHGRRLFEAAKEPKRLRLFPSGDHSDLYDHGAAEAIFKFTETVWDSSRPTPLISSSP